MARANAEAFIRERDICLKFWGQVAAETFTAFGSVLAECGLGFRIANDSFGPSKTREQ